jgi:hypothetical protein
MFLPGWAIGLIAGVLIVVLLVLAFTDRRNGDSKKD